MACRNVSKILHFWANLLHNHKHRRFDETRRGRSGTCHRATPSRNVCTYFTTTLTAVIHAISLPLCPSVRAWHERRRGLLGIQIITWFVRSRRAREGRAWKEGGGERKQVRSEGSDVGCPGFVMLVKYEVIDHSCYQST